MAAATSSSSSLPLLLVLLLLLLAAPATAGDKHMRGGARMVIVRRGAGTRVAGGGGGAADGRRANDDWRRYEHGRLLEDVVAPEELGAGGGSISYGALDKDTAACPSSGQCAGKGGGSYTRPCTYKDHCPQ